MKSTAAESMKMIYKITGPGADEPPIGLFKVDKFTGWLRVTKSLDREETAEYIVSDQWCSKNLDFSVKTVCNFTEVLCVDILICVCVQLTTHASTEDQSYIETPVKIIIKVIDQNDNKPLCTQNPFMGEVQERAKQSRMWRSSQDICFKSDAFVSYTMP